jgi:hypothetical protein
MPVFATGNAGWDQGLNSLAGSLFPDPSKQAQAGLYGAETGQALVKSYQLRDQMAEQRRLQDLMAGGGPIVGPAAPGGPPTPPGATPVIPYTSPTPAPSLAATVAPGVPPSAPNPAAALTPGTGTDGGPTRPDAPPSLAGGGGTPQAPPAQANGQPVSPQMSLPYLMVTAARAGIDPNVVKLLGTSWINEQMRLGKMDAATGNRFLSGAGDPTPLTSATQITTTGMNNATTLEQTRIQGANTVRNTQEQGAQTRQTTDAELMQVVPKGQTTPVQVTKGYIKAHPDQFDAYDSARAIQGDKLGPMSSVPGDTTAPPVMVPQREQAERTPYDEAQAREDAKPMVVIAPDGKTFIPTTVGAYRRNPAMGKPANAEDEKYINASPTPGAPTQRMPQGVVAGGQPLPATAEQLMAERAARLAGAVETDQPDLAGTITEGTRAGQELLGSRTVLTPEQDKVAKQMGATHFASVMYPAGSGWSPLSSTAPAVPSQADQAYHDNLVRLLQRGPYARNPADAEIEAWNMMRRQGILKDKPEVRKVGINPTGAYVDVVRTPDGKGQRLVVHGDYSNIPKDAQGNPIVQGVGGPRTPQATGQAPVAGAGAPPPGALSPAPAGMPNGKILYQRDGSQGVVRDGWVFSPAAAASTPTPAPAASAPKSPGTSLADIFSAPARAVKARMRPHAPKGALSADQVPPS